MNLPQEVQQGGLDGRHDVDHDAQVIGLLATPAGVAIGESRADGTQHIVHLGDRAAEYEFPGFFQGFANGLPAGDFADAYLTVTILQDHEVADKDGMVPATEIEQKAVVPRNGDHFHVFDDRASHGVLFLFLVNALTLWWPEPAGSVLGLRKILPRLIEQGTTKNRRFQMAARRPAGGRSKRKRLSGHARHLHFLNSAHLPCRSTSILARPTLSDPTTKTENPLAFQGAR